MDISAISSSLWCAPPLAYPHPECWTAWNRQTSTEYIEQFCSDAAKFHRSIKYYPCTWLNHKQDMHWIRLFHALHMCVLHLASLALQCYKQKSGRAWGGGYTCIYIFHAHKFTVSVTLHSHIGPVCRRMCLVLDRGSSPCQPSTERLAASQRSWARGGTLSHQGQGRGHSCSWEELYEWQRPQPPPQLSSGRWSVITTFRKH